MRICKDGRGKRPFSDYCRCRRGSPSSGDDCGYDGAPCYCVPVETKALGGVDSLYSIVQMPPGIPVATVAINGAQNAGLLAAKILATEDAALRERLKAYSSKLEQTVLNKADKLEHIGYEAYLKEM